MLNFTLLSFILKNFMLTIKILIESIYNNLNIILIKKYLLLFLILL